MQNLTEKCGRAASDRGCARLYRTAPAPFPLRLLAIAPIAKTPTLASTTPSSTPANSSAPKPPVCRRIHREQARGRVELWDVQGESTGYGRDFTIEIEDGDAQVQFCRSVPVAGVGDTARLKTAVRETLTPFPNISEVTLLNSRGDCFADYSGRNLCWDETAAARPQR